MPQMLFILAFI